MYLTACSLPELLPLIAPAGIGAEIGVLKGEFSAQLLHSCAPQRLHLIDPWEEQTGDYRFDLSNTNQSTQNELHDHVRQTFASEIAAGQVVLHREYSNKAAPGFADGYFDWIYIDGDHTYKGVTDDLELYAPKLKGTGLILGDDFINSAYYIQMKFGVVEAVQDFVRKHGYEFLLLTRDWRFILSKPGNPVAQALIQRFLAVSPFTIHVAGLEKLNYTTCVVPLAQNSARFVHSFR